MRKLPILTMIGTVALSLLFSPLARAEIQGFQVTVEGAGSLTDSLDGRLKDEFKISYVDCLLYLVGVVPTVVEGDFVEMVEWEFVDHGHDEEIVEQGYEVWDNVSQADGEVVTGLCGDEECGADQVCFEEQCCDYLANCAGKQCGDDGCGGECKPGWI